MDIREALQRTPGGGDVLEGEIGGGGIDRELRVVVQDLKQRVRRLTDIQGTPR